MSACFLKYILTFFITTTFANLLTSAVTGGTLGSIPGLLSSFGNDGDIHLYAWNSSGLWNSYHTDLSLNSNWWAQTSTAVVVNTVLFISTEHYYTVEPIRNK